MAVLDARGALVVVWTLALVPPLLPIDVSLPLSATESRAFLQVLWQVEAATVALTITIVLFVFQVFSSRTASSVHDFAEETGLFPIFHVGVSAIALTGLVSLGYGHGGVDGWAATWATTWSGIGLVLVAVLFVTALRAIDVTDLRARRIERARHQVDGVVDRVILERIAHHLLTEECERAHIEMGWLGDERDGRVPLHVGRTGRVHDVNLRVLRTAGREARATQLLPPRLTVKLGDPVGHSTPWLAAQPVLLAIRPSITRVLTVRNERGTDDRLRQTLEELHEEALAAITTPAPVRYRDIVDAYTDIVMRLPEAWGRFGHRLERDVGVSTGLFGWTFLDTLRSNAYEEALHALAGTDRDVAQEILNFPLDVATRAVPLHALALARTALELLSSYQHALLRSEHPHKEMLKSWLHTRVREYADFHIEPILTRDGHTLEDRQQAERAMGDVFRTFAELMKACLDFDQRDTKSLSEISTEWNLLLRHWEPEHRQPDVWLVEALERERGIRDPEVVQLRREAEVNAELAAIKDRLVRLKQLHRFGLCFWALRRYRSTQSSTWLESFNLLGEHFGSLQALTTAVADAMQHEWDHHGPWSGWILNDLPLHNAHMVSPESEFVTTYVVLALRLIDPADSAPELPDSPNLGMHLRADDPRAVIERVLGDASLTSVLPERGQERAAKLVDALALLIARIVRAEEDETIAASVDEDAVTELQTEARAEWAERGLLRAAFAERGRLMARTDEPPTSTRYSVGGWQPKGFFLKEKGRVFGGERLAAELVNSLVSAQTTAVLRLSGLEDDVPPVEVPLDDYVRAAIAAMRDAGADPRVLLVPTKRSIVTDLGAEGAVRWGGDVEPPSWLPDGARGLFRGRIEGMSVHAMAEIPDDRIALCDFGRFGEWHEWPAAGQPLVTVETFDELSARELAKQSDSADDPETLIRRIRSGTRVSAEVAFEVVVERPDAIRWISVGRGKA